MIKRASGGSRFVNNILNGRAVIAVFIKQLPCGVDNLHFSVAGILFRHGAPPDFMLSLYNKAFAKSRENAQMLKQDFSAHENKNDSARKLGF